MALIAFLVEDSQIIQDSLIAALEEVAGTIVLGIAETEAAAILWLMTPGNRWDLVVVDLFLKQGNGLGVLERCRNRASHQRVVLLTNYPTTEIRRRALDLGADAVFDKSTELENLFEFAAQIRTAT